MASSDEDGHGERCDDFLCEPFSACGNGTGINWDDRLDGKSKKKSFSKEQETILQRGTSVRITGIRKNGVHLKFGLR